MRAAGFWAGLATAILDLLKSATSVWLVRYLASHGFVSPSPWLEAVAPIAAILGHNYSIFLSEKDASGRLRLRGGAGGAPTAGGAFGLWPPSLLFIVPVAVLLLFGIGYASVATLSIGLVTLFVFAYRAWAGSSPWQFILYGVFAEILLAWALRPNIQRLINGTERLVGLRARKKNKPASSSAQDSG
jgi:glycerol-3-phosphate acyltransferase PlsY